MKKKNAMLILSAVFVLLLGGAYVLYGKLGQDVAAEQLVVADRPSTVHAEMKETQPPETEVQQEETQPQETEVQQEDTQPPETEATDEAEPVVEPATDFTVSPTSTIYTTPSVLTAISEMPPSVLLYSTLARLAGIAAISSSPEMSLGVNSSAAPTTVNS